jgi:hypothetical protein
LAAVDARGRADVHDPVGVADDVQLVLDDEQGVAAGLQLVEGPEQGLGVGRVQPGGRLVQHVHHPEQVRPHLSGQPQPLQLAGGQGGRTAVEGQVPEPKVEQDAQPGDQVAGDPAGDLDLLRVLVVALRAVLLGVGAEDGGQLLQRLAGQGGDVVPGERDRQGLGPEPLAVAGRAAGAHQVLGHPPLHGGALGPGEGLQHVPPGAGEGAQVVVRLFPLLRPPDLLQAVVRVDGHLRPLVGEQEPVAGLPRQVPPRDVNVNVKGGEDVAEVLPLPGPRPRGDGPLADRE